MSKTKTYNVKRPIPKPKSFKCNICGATYSNENFDITNEKDCAICDNRDCAQKIS